MTFRLIIIITHLLGTRGDIVKKIIFKIIFFMFFS